MDENGQRTPIEAVRIGPGQFLLAAETLRSTTVFRVGDEIFEVASEPVAVGGGRYFATVEIRSGPASGRRLTAQLQVGRRVQ
jgi:hypothetical protein